MMISTLSAKISMHGANMVRIMSNMDMILNRDIQRLIGRHILLLPPDNCRLVVQKPYE